MQPLVPPRCVTRPVSNGWPYSSASDRVFSQVVESCETITPAVILQCVEALHHFSTCKMYLCARCPANQMPTPHTIKLPSDLNAAYCKR